MEKVLEVRAYLMKIYAKYSRYLNGAFRFVLALLTFSYIARHSGFVDLASNPAVIIGLSSICIFLPTSMTAVLAALMILVQLCGLAPGVAIVVGVAMLIMFVFYFRFAQGKGTVLLLTPIAFACNVPVLIPIVFGMIGGPASVIPIALGTIIYYMLTYVKSYATLIETVAESGIVSQMSSFAQQLFSNKEMWMTIIAFTVCLLIVYNIRRLSIDYAWEIAAITGALTNLLMMTFGYVIMDVPLEIELIPGSIIAVFLAIIVKVFVFSVNYTRSEYLQFEDDEYYYYVKAVPKLSVAVREKTVKKINSHQTIPEAETEDDVELEEDVIQEIKPVDLEESEIQRIIEEELKK